MTCVSRTALLLAVVLGALGDPCETGTDAAGFNAPCTRTKDCAGGLLCQQGMCTSADGGASDGGGDQVRDADVTDGVEGP
jgi:hypothetical protein